MFVILKWNKDKIERVSGLPAKEELDEPGIIFMLRIIFVSVIVVELHYSAT